MLLLIVISLMKCNIVLELKLFLPFDLSCRTYTETDSDLPCFPDDFQVAKYCIFQTVGPQCARDADGSRLVPFSPFSFFLSLFFSTKGQFRIMVYAGAAERQCGERTAVPRGQILEGGCNQQCV